MELNREGYLEMKNKIIERKKNVKFMGRLKKIMSRDKEILDRLSK